MSQNLTVTVIHLPAEKAALSVVGLVLAPILSVVVYHIAQRALHVREGETSKSKAHLFYRMMSGLLVAQFIGHTYWYSAPFWFIAMFVAVGYVAMDVGESVGRAWNKNPHNYGPPDHAARDDIGLNRRTNKVHHVMVVDDITSADLPQDIQDTEDSVKDMTKRTWMLFMLVWCLSIICCADGFHLAVAPVTVAILVSYYVHGVGLSLVVYGAMIHAKFHNEEVRPWLWWSALTLLWSIMYFLSALLVVIGVPQAVLLQVSYHPAFIAAYGFASGMLLKIQHYFHAMKGEANDRREMWLGIVVLVMATAVGMATSVYL
jgi:hypothetical protein